MKMYVLDHFVNDKTEHYYIKALSMRAAAAAFCEMHNVEICSTYIGTTCMTAILSDGNCISINRVLRRASWRKRAGKVLRKMKKMFTVACLAGCALIAAGCQSSGPVHADLSTRSSRIDVGPIGASVHQARSATGHRQYNVIPRLRLGRYL